MNPVDANRAAWDAKAKGHLGGHSAYPIAAFKAGTAGMKPNTPDDLGDVRGKRLLHLQCHFGMDTLMWARQGAVVTGVDFSPVAIEAARKLAAEVGIEARFVGSEISALPGKLKEAGEFDVAIGYFGTIPWLPDLKAWGKVIAHYLKPGGFFYVADTHPFAYTFDIPEGEKALRQVAPYFNDRVARYESEGGTYASPKGTTPPTVTYEWTHKMSDILNALIEAGLRIEYLHEFPYSFYDIYYATAKGYLREDEYGWWWPVERKGDLPLMFSVRAVR